MFRKLYSAGIADNKTSTINHSAKYSKKVDKLACHHLVPINDVQQNNAEKSKFKLSEKTRQKYNTAVCTAITLERNSILSLINAYHEIHGLPGFVHRFLHGRPSLERALFVAAPDMYRIFDTKNEESKTILMTNPAYIDQEHFFSECKQYSPNYAIKNLKNSPNGLALITWFLHPDVLPDVFRKNSPSSSILEKRLCDLKKETECFHDNEKFLFYRYGKDMTPLQKIGSFSRLPRTKSQKKISDMEVSSSHQYLACLFDLDCNPKWSLKYLKLLRDNILHELETVYGVTSEDKIKIYLHMPYLDATTTLHVHIRVNQGDHALEESKSFGLNEIINQLESGLLITDMIIERGTIYCAEFPIGENIEGITVRTVPNPKRDWADILKMLNVSTVTCEYLLNEIKNEEILKRMQLLDSEEIGKLANQIGCFITVPSTQDLIKMITQLDTNKILSSLGWLLETGECVQPTTSCNHLN